MIRVRSYNRRQRSIAPHSPNTIEFVGRSASARIWNNIQDDHQSPRLCNCNLHLLLLRTTYTSRSTSRDADPWPCHATPSVCCDTHRAHLLTDTSHLRTTLDTRVQTVPVKTAMESKQSARECEGSRIHDQRPNSNRARGIWRLQMSSYPGLLKA